MLSCEYKKDFDHSYLILTELIEGKGGYEEKVLVNNDIKGFLRCQIRNINSQNKYFYDITSRQSMESAYAIREIEYEDIKNLFLMLKSAADEIKKYLLDSADIVLNPIYIYMEIESGTIWFLYFPGYQGNTQEDLQALTEFLLNKINHKDNRAVDFTYWLYDYVRKEQFSILKIIGYFEKEKYDVDITKYKKQQAEPEKQEEESVITAEQGIKTIDTAMTDKWLRQKSLLPGALLSVLVPVLLEAVSAFLIFTYFDMEFKETVILFGFYGLILAGSCILAYRKIAKVREMNNINTADQKNIEFAETEEDCEEKLEDGDGYGETTYLGSSGIQRQDLLIGRIRGKDIQIKIDSYPFIIGKMKGHVNYTIQDMSVSRMHAKFFQKEDMVYLTDLNSTNGTYKNGVPLEVNEEVLVSPGDEIQMGSLTFTYH